MRRLCVSGQRPRPDDLRLVGQIRLGSARGSQVASVSAADPGS
jgi:hypothetical protein